MARLTVVRCERVVKLIAVHISRRDDFFRNNYPSHQYAIIFFILSEISLINQWVFVLVVVREKMMIVSAVRLLV